MMDTVSEPPNLNRLAANTPQHGTGLLDFGELKRLDWSYSLLPAAWLLLQSTDIHLRLKLR